MAGNITSYYNKEVEGSFHTVYILASMGKFNEDSQSSSSWTYQQHLTSRMTPSSILSLPDLYTALLCFPPPALASVLYTPLLFPLPQPLQAQGEIFGLVSFLSLLIPLEIVTSKIMALNTTLK